MSSSFIYNTYRLYDTEDNTIPTYASGFLMKYSDTTGLDEDDLFFWVVMNTMMLLFASIKLMYFLRIYDTCVQLLEVLVKVIESIIPFTVFFFIFIFIITLEYHISGIIVKTKNYHHMNNYYGLQVFRNAVGDPQPPTLDFWGNKTHDWPIISTIMVYFGWFLWILCIYLNMMILVNFLIVLNILAIVMIMHIVKNSTKL